MRGLIQASLGNPHAVVVGTLTVVILGILTLLAVPQDILPVFKSPAVQVLTFYGGMPAEAIEKNITVRMERWTGQANGMRKQESRSVAGASIVRNYFQDSTDPNGALTQVNSLALAVVPNLPPGTLPPVVLPFDPTSTTPIALVTLKTRGNKPPNEAILYDLARYKVRNFIMQNPGATAPVAIGGKVRAVILYLDHTKMQSHRLSPEDVMNAVEKYNLFFADGDVKVGEYDYALSSNSMYDLVERMKEIPIGNNPQAPIFLGAVATPMDASFIQTNVVRVDGKRQVYIPVYRQQGASTLDVVDTLRATLPEMQQRLGENDIELQVAMDQSDYVRAAIRDLEREGFIGAILCSLVILVFLGQWRMTLIAIITLPISVLAAIIGLHYTGQTINVMTLAGLTLAIGPMIDSAIICLENTHRYLAMGATPRTAALNGASEVAMPELVSTLCTFLVLAPLALMPGMGKFLFLPMTLAVMFAMTTAYILSRTLVPCASAFLLHHHEQDISENRGMIGRAFARWERLIDAGIGLYVRSLDFVLRFRYTVVVAGFALLALTLLLLLPVMRREFFPEVDSRAFEIAVRAPSGLRIEETEKRIVAVEQLIREKIPEHDLKTVISEIGLTSDWAAAYTPNAGPMDAIVKVQLEEFHRGSLSSQEYIRMLREAFTEPNPKDYRFKGLEFSFDAGGLVRGALNEGKSTPINIQLVGRDLRQLAAIAENVKRVVQTIDGVVDVRVLEKLDYPQWTINVDRAKAAAHGLNQDDIMKNVIAATNGSTTFNKRNFWIDLKRTGNQYYVGVQYPEQVFHTQQDVKNIPITSPKQGVPIPLENVATLEYSEIPTESHHVNLQPTIDLTMNVEGRDLGHVSVDVARVLERRFGVRHRDKRNVWDGTWVPEDPYFATAAAEWQVHDREGTLVATWKSRKGEPREAEIVTEGGRRLARWVNTRGDHREIEIVTDGRGRERVVLPGSRIVLSGEYARMQDTFRDLGLGLILASVLIYFLMVALDRSFIVPLAVMLIVPLCLIGILPMLYLTGSAINVQSLLGFIFIVGIKVANTVLMTDYAQELRRHEGLSPMEAIRKAASLRVRPVTMTALAAFFAMIPTALAEGEANAPLARAILGGLIAGELATLFVLPALYAILVRGSIRTPMEEHHPAPAGTGLD
jgi:multidrug efflux pump subunit AcrB